MVSCDSNLEELGVFVWRFRVSLAVATADWFDGPPAPKDLVQRPVLRFLPLVMHELGRPRSSVAQDQVAARKVHALPLERQDAAVVGDIEGQDDEQVVHADDRLAVGTGWSEPEARN